MALLDWIALCAPLVMVIGIAAYTSRYLKSVADYMAGGRCAGRYMLCVARGEMGAGAAVFVAMFEIFGRAGFTYTWWSWIMTSVVLLIAISGFVVYRYRETRALTLAQFFEMRYSRKFRIFAGGLGFMAGIMNFGIIPAIGARFFVYFLGLPDELSLFGISVPTFVLMMAALLSVTIFLTVAGGQITVMVTDCISGLMDQWLFMLIIIVLLCMFDWSQISSVLMDRSAGESMMNPFDSMKLKDFNLWYILMSVFVTIYGTMAWQNASAYNSAALTAHESRMGNILGRWREFAKLLAITILAMVAVTFLNAPEFATQAVGVQETLDQIANPQIREQMLIPTALSILLPIGIKGALCAIVITGIFGGDTTHLHSWGSMFVQDVLLPLRKKPLEPQQHIRTLRWAMVGVAVFAFLFGSLFSQTEYVVMWFRITMAIYVGGAGSVIIGGLYWKKGTTEAAWAAMLTGSILSVGGIITRQILPEFPFNGLQISFGATLIAIGVYGVVSLLTSKGREFNLDRMLHRGQYAVEEDRVQERQKDTKEKFRWSKLIGIDDKYSRGDRWIACGVFWWAMLWLGVLVVGCIWHWIQPWPDSVWPTFWWWAGIMIPLIVAAATTIWFTWGVVRDLKVFFRSLKQERVDVHDDGSVDHSE